MIKISIHITDGCCCILDMWIVTSGLLLVVIVALGHAFKVTCSPRSTLMIFDPHRLLDKGQVKCAVERRSDHTYTFANFKVILHHTTTV